MKKFKTLIIIVVIALILGILYCLNISNKKQYTTKEDIIALLDKGLESSSQVNIFIISRENLDDEYTKIINEGKYKDLIGFIDLSKYRGQEFEFTFLKETDNCILGYFSENHNNINGTTYIRVNKLNGQLEDLDNNLFKVTIYE